MMGALRLRLALMSTYREDMNGNRNQPTNGTPEYSATTHVIVDSGVTRRYREILTNAAADLGPR